MPLFFSMTPTSRLTVRPPPPIYLSLMTSWRLENWPWISVNEMRGLGSGQWICFIKSQRVMVSHLLLIFAIPCIARLNSVFVSLREIFQFSNCLTSNWFIHSEWKNEITMRKFWQVLAVRQTLWKNGGSFLDRVNNKSSIPIFLVSSKILTLAMESRCIFFERNLFFWDRININSFTKPLYFQAEFSVRRYILSTNTLYILHPYKKTIEYVSKRASQRAGVASFSEPWTAEKNSCLPHVPHY